MKVKKYAIISLLILFFIIPSSIFAQEEEEEEIYEEIYEPTFSLGDNMFIIKVGLTIPLFLNDLDFNVLDTNLTLGGAGSLEWSTFLSNNWAIGAEFGGLFAFTPNMRVLYTLPLTVKATWFLRFHPFELLLYAGAGISFTSVDDSFHVDWILKPGASLYWNLNSDWAFGVNVIYWWIPQIYTEAGDINPEHSRFANFLETSLSALFHF